MGLATKEEANATFRYNLTIRTIAGENGRTTFRNPIPASIDPKYSGCLFYVDSLSLINPIEDADPPNVPTNSAYKLYIEGANPLNAYETDDVLQQDPPVNGNHITGTNFRPLRVSNYMGIYPVIGQTQIRPETKFNGNVRDNGIFLGSTLPALTEFTIFLEPFDYYGDTWGSCTLNLDIIVQLVENTTHSCCGGH